MGIPMQFMMGTMKVGALYGWENVAVGWMGHLFHSVVFGLIFAGIISIGPLKEYGVKFPTNLGVGAAYGLGLWVFGGVIAVPLWLQSAGVGYAPAVPDVDPVSLLAHVIYGGVLGVVYPISLRYLPVGATKTSRF